MRLNAPDEGERQATSFFSGMAAFPPPTPGTARFADRCVSNGQNQKCFTAVSIVLGTVSTAWAQTADSKACTEQERSNQTLSEKLGQTHGVICPPDIDRGMKAPTPDAGKTPVIPPPGSPGGNPNVHRNNVLSSYSGSMAHHARVAAIADV
jgi:hypothetical protein